MDTSTLLHTFNIGVTGHRQLPPASSKRIEKITSIILQVIKSAAEEVRQSSANADFMQHFDHGEDVRLQIISSLAEGADRLVAHEGKKQGYKLLVPLPFSQSVYEDTFKRDDKELTNFRTLLNQADKVLEISASNSNSSQAYADASRLMLSHSDLLLAFWNGQQTKYIAGTYPTMKAAYKAGVPIIYIPVTETQDSTDANSIAVITDAETRKFDILNPDKQGLEQFAAFIKEYIVSTLLPEHSCDFHDALSLHHQYDFLAENSYTESTFLNKCFFSFRKSFNLYKSPIDNSSKVATDNVWEEIKKTFSKKSRRYEKKYKSCLLWRNLLPIFALIFLVLAINVDAFSVGAIEAYKQHIKFGFYGAQVLCWFAFWGLVSIQKIICHTYQHHRSYRYIAEYCRISSHLWSVGYVHSLSSSPLKKSRQFITSWYCRLLTRNAGFPATHLNLDIDAVQVWLQCIKNNFLSSQLDYHRRRYDKFIHHSKILNIVAQLLYWFGMLAVVCRGLADWLVKNHGMDNIYNLVVIAIAFTIPSVGAFFSTYNNCSGYGSESGTSADMHSALLDLLNECNVLCEKLSYEKNPENASTVSPYRNAQLIDSNVCYSHVYDFCERIDKIMNGEVAEWSASSYSNLEKYL